MQHFISFFSHTSHIMLSLSAILSYLFGSIPFGLVITRMAGLGDIRTMGSGNIGTTNVLRTGRKDLAFLTVVGDIGKGAFAVYICSLIGGMPLATIACLFSVLGHNYPIWLKFKGGKGVATTFGVWLVFAFPVGICGLLTWLAIAIIFRYSSLSALISMLMIPVYAYLFHYPLPIVIVGVILTLSSYWKHRGNIQRLVKGEEDKIGKKKKNKNTQDENTNENTNENQDKHKES